MVWPSNQELYEDEYLSSSFWYESVHFFVLSKSDTVSCYADQRLHDQWTTFTIGLFAYFSQRKAKLQFASYIDDYTTDERSERIISFCSPILLNFS
jgi:hypothetical protein